MRGDADLTEIETELATAVGFVILSNASLHEAAHRAGISRGELEECLREHALDQQLDVNIDTDVKEEIDRVLEERLA